MCECTCTPVAEEGQVWWAKYPSRETLSRVRVREVTAGTILITELGFGPTLRFSRSDLVLVERDTKFERPLFVVA